MNDRGSERRVLNVLVVVAAALVVVMGYELALRIAYPWDYFIWSESTFLTNVLKLSTGERLYSDPSLANSYVYSPGLEYLTYALLRPLSLQLDIRACRVVNVLVGLCAAWAASQHASEDLRLRLLSFLAFSLLLFENFTFDVCHPDNIHVAHVGVTFLLSSVAATSGRYGMALGAVAFSALGVLAKQSGGLAWVGTTTALVALHGRAWGLARSAGLVATGLGAAATAFAILLAPQNARFYVIDLVRERPLELFRAPELLRDIAHAPHRALLALSAGPALMALASRDDVRARRHLVCWLALGAATLPALVGYFKQNGVWNNLGVLDYWLALLVIPSLFHALRAPPKAMPRLLPAAAAGMFLLLLLSAFPTKMPPSRGRYAYGHVLEGRISGSKDATTIGSTWSSRSTGVTCSTPSRPTIERWSACPATRPPT
jgi:hypothetical protein